MFNVKGGKKLLHCCEVGDVNFVKCEIWIFEENSKAVFFEFRVIVVVEVINTYDNMTLIEQAL